MQAPEAEGNIRFGRDDAFHCAFYLNI